MILEQLINGISLGSIYGLIALGYSMVYGMLGILNFAHGDVFMLGGMLGWVFCTLFLGMLSPTLSLLAASVIVALICGFVGWAKERFAYRPLTGGGRLAPLLTALGVSIFLQNIILLTFGGRARIYQTAVLLGGWPSVTFLGVQLSAARQLMIIASFVLMLCLDYFSHHTTFGTAVRAVAQDRNAAAYVGIDVKRTLSVVFIAGSVLAGVAGILAGLYYGQADFSMGYSAGLKAFAATVLGGVGQMRGAALGGLVLGITESLSVLFLPPVYRDLVTFALIIGVLLLRPQGILGQYIPEKV